MLDFAAERGAPPATEAWPEVDRPPADDSEPPGEAQPWSGVGLRGEPDAALEKAPRRLRGSTVSNAADQFYLEGHVAMALPQDDGGTLIYSSTQHPDEVQHLVAEATGRKSKDVVCTCRRIGGAFGGKESQAATIACIAALMAVKTGRPCKLPLDRDDDMIISGGENVFPREVEDLISAPASTRAEDEFEVTVALTASARLDLSRRTVSSRASTTGTGASGEMRAASPQT